MTQSPKTALRFLKELAEQKSKLIALVFLGTVFNVVMSVIPLIMAQGVDNLVQLIRSKPLASITMPEFVAAIHWQVLWIALGVAIISLFSFLQEFLMARFSEEVALRLRTKVIRKFKKLPIRYFDTHQVGDTMSRTTADLKRVSDFLVNNVNQMISSVLSILLGVSLMFYLSVRLTLVVLLVTTLSVFATRWIAQKNKEVADLNQKNLGEFSSVAEELYTGNSVIKAFNMQAEATEKFTNYNTRYYQSFKKSQFITFSIYPAIRFLNQLSFIVSAVMAAALVIQGKLSIGAVQAYLQYVNQIGEPITNSSYVINAAQSALASIERVFEILDAEELPQQKLFTELEQPKGHIEFQDVQFGYTPENILMKKVTFEAQANQMIAIVGPTGAGKTTLVNLLMRFYELNGGTITFDGIPINELKTSTYRRMFGMVLQDSWLFDGTVAENIAYGKPHATMAEIEAAARAAQCDYFIRTLPEGYQTKITDGGNSMSQGQQQLLTIARVLLVNPNVVILDEATSSVDTRTEIAVQAAMKQMMQGRTSFVIAHRLSTITSADLILVMQKGDIIEQGTHQELLAKKGFYENLFNSQFAK